MLLWVILALLLAVDAAIGEFGRRREEGEQREHRVWIPRRRAPNRRCGEDITRVIFYLLLYLREGRRLGLSVYSSLACTSSSRPSSPNANHSTAISIARSTILTRRQTTCQTAHRASPFNEVACRCTQHIACHQHAARRTHARACTSSAVAPTSVPTQRTPGMCTALG